MSRYIPVGTACDHCHNKDLKWMYRYHETIYCKQCFNDHFEIKQCTGCKEDKYIYYQLKDAPLCKVCEIKDKPCIRCNREIKKFGKIMNKGPVCMSCSKYFREEKQCMVCFKYSLEVANRSINGSTQPTCTSCFNKTLPTCSGCHRKRETHTYNDKGRPLCKKCSEGNRVCLSCENTFPAGRGRICQQCSSKNGLIKKVNSAKKELGAIFSIHFENFALWLSNKRGSKFASHHILNYLPWFQKLNQLAEQLGKTPLYTDVVSTYSVAETRQYLLATRYMDKAHVITINKDAQKIHADLDMIQRYLETFPKKSEYREMVSSYHDYLEEKNQNGKMSIRSMRLALTPAVRFFKYCDCGEVEKPSQELLESYLWCFYGQKNAISGFILFLNRGFGYSFSIKEIYRPVLERPRSSQKYLEHKFLTMLRNKEQFQEKKYDEFIRTTIGYLHQIDIPKHVKLSFCDLKKSGKGYQIRLAGEIFILPEEIICST